MLVGIDGTNSKKWASEDWTSHVRAMVNDYAGESVYFHGPEDSGTNLQKAVNESVKWILDRIKVEFTVEERVGGSWKHIGSKIERNYSKAYTSALFLKHERIVNRKTGASGAMRQTFRFLHNDGVNLVGFSRGGLGVIEVAKALKRYSDGLKVNFMGLFDAVDRHVFLDGSVIPGNVSVVRHAIRHPDVVSRDWFENTGTSIEGDPDRYVGKLFAGTHGAMGGDAKGGDRAYSVGRPRGLGDIFFYGLPRCNYYIPLPGAILPVDCELVTVAENREVKNEVLSWMLNEATSHGLAFQCKLA